METARGTDTIGIAVGQGLFVTRAGLSRWKDGEFQRLPRLGREQYDDVALWQWLDSMHGQAINRSISTDLKLDE